MNTFRKYLTPLLVLVAVCAIALGLAPAALGAAMGAMVVGATTELSDEDMQNAMKIYFSDSIVNNVVTDSELMQYFDQSSGVKTDQTTGGRWIETAQLFGLPAGFGSRGTNGYIPVPYGPQIENSRIYLKKQIGSVEISGDVLKRVKQGLGGFIDWGAQVMPGLVERATNEYDRMLIGYGAGVKAVVESVDGVAKSIKLKDAFGVTGYGGAAFLFLEGEPIRAADKIDGDDMRAGVMRVQNIDFANNTIYVDQLATAIEAGDFLAEGDAADNSFADKDVMGLLGIIDDGSILKKFQNIDRDEYLKWRAHVIDAQKAPFTAGQKLTEAVINYADRVASTRGGAKVTDILTSREARDQYWADLKSDRTYVDPRSFTGGRGPVSIILDDREVPIRVIRKMPTEVAFGITKGTLKRWLLNEFEWDSTTGSLFRQVTDNTGRKDAFYAYGTSQMQTGSTDPQKNFRIENIAMP